MMKEIHNDNRESNDDSSNNYYFNDKDNYIS